MVRIRTNESSNEQKHFLSFIYGFGRYSFRSRIRIWFTLDNVHTVTTHTHITIFNKVTVMVIVLPAQTHTHTVRFSHHCELNGSNTRRIALHVQWNHCAKFKPTIASSLLFERSTDRIHELHYLKTLPFSQ